MNSTFEKYDFPQSRPKKVLIPLVSGKDNQSLEGGRILSKSRITRVTYSQELSEESAVWLQKLVTKLLMNKLDIDDYIKVQLLESADRRYQYKGGSK